MPRRCKRRCKRRARISQAANPRLAAAARAARQDLERVQSAEWPDMNHLLAQLDALWGQMDGLPVAHEWAGAITHEITRESAPASAEKAADAASDAAAASWWQRAWAEAAQLVRVSRIEPPDAGVMSAQQTAIMRQHVKMRVQGARLALLAGRRDAAQAELARAAHMAAALFDAQAPAARDALARLQQAQSALQGGASVPGAAATLAALVEAAQVDAPAAAEANTGASHNAHDAHDARTGDF